MESVFQPVTVIIVNVIWDTQINTVTALML